jgi:hypothetical protein
LGFNVAKIRSRISLFQSHSGEGRSSALLNICSGGEKSAIEQTGDSTSLHRFYAFLQVNERYGE